MRFVDEYRDPAMARTLVARITALAGDDNFKFMEVCGGHTHTIYRHGIEHVLPASVELVLLPVHAYCTACETDWECDEQPAACDLCGSPSIELRGGDELVLESIEYRPTG